VEKDERLVKLGNRIKELRLQKGISQVELANRIGKDQPSLNRVEKGNINPSYIYLVKICEGVGVEMSELFRKD
jgi:transcriptional regulator with XRE-family HTH domain